MNFSAYRTRVGLRIPTSINQLAADEGIVCGLLKEVYQLEKKDVEELEVTLPEKGDIRGNLSDSGRVQVRVKTTAGTEEVFHWFVKVMPRNHHNNELVSKFNVFKNEIEFYSKIAPELKAFLKEGIVSDQEVHFDIPEMLFAKQDEDRAIIVLQDLTHQGFTQDRDRNGNRYLSKEKAVLAVESIAKIHAASYALQLREKVDLKRDHPTLEESGLLWTRDEMTSRLFAMKDIYCSLLEESDKPDSPNLLARFKSAFNSEDMLRELCRSRCNSEESVGCLQQGDFHFNNLLFREEGGRLQVSIVDWQLTYTGRAGGDISYLLMSSLDPVVRETEEEDIKQRYYDMFINTLGLLKRATDYEMENQLKEDYQKSLPLGFFFSCGNIMAEERSSNKSSKVGFTYQLCKDAAKKQLI